MLKTLFYSYFWLTAIANDGKFIKPGLSFDGVDGAATRRRHRCHTNKSTNNDGILRAEHKKCNSCVKTIMPMSAFLPAFTTVASQLLVKYNSNNHKSLLTLQTKSQRSDAHSSETHQLLLVAFCICHLIYNLTTASRQIQIVQA